LHGLKHRFTGASMAKADRLQRLDARRADLEAEYRQALIAALRVTASGKWGLFDHNADRHARAFIAPVIAELAELGGEIDAAREQLFMEPFALRQEFLSARGPVDSQAVGEPKQAQAWLDRLSSES
jgi:hypothetical protein